MIKKNIISETNLVVNKTVKLAINLPDDKIGNQAKHELIKNSTIMISKLNMILLENNYKNSISLLTNVIEHTGKVNFWLAFLRDEGYTTPDDIKELTQRNENLIRELINLKHEDESKIPTAYAGEWFLDD